MFFEISISSNIDIIIYGWKGNVIIIQKNRKERIMAR